MTDGDTADPTDNTTRHVRQIDDLQPETVRRLLDRAAASKRGEQLGRLDGATLAMLFEQPSTRTRVSAETGMTQLGGHAQFLAGDDLQLDRGEPIEDTARALSRYVDGLMARVASHDTLTRLTDAATVPVINGLTDAAHPCQTLADLQTIRETVGLDASITWVGDANNVCRSLIRAAAMLDVSLTVATPPTARPDEAVLGDAEQLGRVPTVSTDPATAVTAADAVYTDVWTSMSDGQQADYGSAFRVDQQLLDHAAADAVVMHCLPAHRGEEITADVLEGSQSVVWEQAENRLHTQKALFVELLGGG